MNRVINIENLPKIMSDFCPSIIPLLYYGDKDKMLLNDGSEEHSSGLTPDEFAYKNDLIENKIFNRNKCKDVLVKQLGNRINSIDDLTDIEKTMFTIFASRIWGDYGLNESIDICDTLNKSCHEGEFMGKKGYPILDSVSHFYTKYLEKHRLEIDSVINDLKYSRVFLFELHGKAVRKGKLPTSFFRWLKGMDRPLFYVLNTTGRLTPWVESAGVFNHYLWVTYSKEKPSVIVNEPMIKEAVNGIEEYLTNFKHIEKIGHK